MNPAPKVRIPRHSPDWSLDDYDLLLVLAEQTAFPFKALDNPEWWEKLSVVLGGLDVEQLKIEFLKMELWIMENPGRRPRNIKRFVRNWLVNRKKYGH